MLTDLLKEYKFRGILLDTNLLLLYLIGSFDHSFVPKFKRTAMYSEDDSLAIKKYSEQFSKIIVTPQILAEAWNFIEKINNKKLNEFLESILPTLYLLEENYIEKDTILDSQSLIFIGITDLSVIFAAKNTGCLVLTDDLRAYDHFSRNSITTININHFRKL